MSAPNTDVATELHELRKRLESQEIATLAMQVERDRAQIAMHQIQLAYIDKALPSTQASLQAGEALLKRKRKEFMERYK